MNLNATKCTFRHSDITSRKQQKAKKLCNMRYRNNTVFVIFEHWATKCVLKHIYCQYCELSALVLAHNTHNFPICIVKR